MQTGRFPARKSEFYQNYISVTADMTSATWNTVASHETFTVTGPVNMIFLIECTGTLTDAADAATIRFGREGDTASIIALTNAAGAGGTTISANQFWFSTAPTPIGTPSTIYLPYVSYNLDIGYEIVTAALTGGTLIFHCWWEPASPSTAGSVVAGAGGSL